MLGYLEGKLLTKNPDTLQGIVLSGHVGYEITVPKTLFETLVPETSVTFWIHTHVREDQLVLFGFAAEAEKQFFRVLLGVSGLGPKTALSLIGEHGAEKLVQLIAHKDTDAISEAPGVGKKLAQKIVLDLASKVEKLAWLDKLPRTVSSAAPARPILSPERQLREDLSSALANLGYHPQQVKNTLDKMFDRDDTAAQGFASCLKTALQEMSGRPVTTQMEN